VFAGLHPQRDLFDDLDSIDLQAVDLLGIVGQNSLFVVASGSIIVYQ